MAGGGPQGDDFDDGGFEDLDPPGVADSERGDVEGDPAQAALARWTAEAQVADAVARRRRAGWLARQAAADADLAGVATALGERGRPVLVGLVSGRRHRGQITVVGGDFIELATEQGPVWLALAALAWVRAPTGDPIASGPPARDQRTGPRTRVELVGELAELAAERTRVAVFARLDDEPVVGELVTVGQDVLTVRDDGGGLIYVALASVAEVSVPESG
jgi:hypothetical protein